MKIVSIAAFIAVFTVFFTFISLAQGSVGVSPGTVSLGKVESGSTKLVDFFVVSPSEETMLVRLEPERVTLEKSSINENTSEEDITSWIKVVNNPVELEPVNETLRTIGGTIKGQRQVSFLIDIPRNAEPGEHEVRIKPIPVVYAEPTAPVGGMVVAITSIKVIFDVIGNPVRSGAILDVEAGNHANNNLEIKTYFQNTGTNTISTSGTQKVYDNDGNLIKEFSLENTYVSPKQIKTFRTFLKTDELPFEDYNVYTVIDYKTGLAEKSSIITLTPPTALAIEEGSNIIWIILIVIVVIISIIIYRKTK